MLNVDPANLWSEIQSAERYRDKHVASLSTRIKRYTGPLYSSTDMADYDPENGEFEYLSLALPDIAFENPRARVSTIRESMRDVATSIQAGLNRWIRDVRLKKTLNAIATDYIMGWGCALVTSERDDQRVLPDDLRAQFGSGPAYRPSVRRISMRRVFWDPIALCQEELRYIGHKYTMDKDDMLALAKADPQGWTIESITGLTADQGVGDMRRGTAQVNTDINTPTRNEVVLYDVYVPGYQVEGEPGPDEGFNGALFTLAVGGDKASLVRPARMFYGPITGPYIVFGAYNVPDETAPLAPTVAIAGVNATLNLHARAVDEATAARKRCIFVSSGDPQLVNLVKAGKDGAVYATNLDDLTNKIKEVELAGTTPQMLEGLQIQRERRDRISGMSDAMRGNVTGDATATENNIAAASGSARMAYVRSQFAEGVTTILTNVAFYLYHDDRIIFPLPADASQQMGMPPGVPGAVAPMDTWFQGGEAAQGSGSSFQDLDLDIEPYSMQRTTEATQQQRVQEIVMIAAQVLPALITGPFNIKETLTLLGGLMNTPELAKIVDLPSAQMLQAINLQNMVSPPQPTDQPRLGNDVGGGAAKPAPQPSAGVSPPGGSIPKPANKTSKPAFAGAK